MRHLHAHFLCRKRAGDRGVHVAHDDGPVGPILLEDLLEGDHDPGRLLRMAARTRPQVVIRRRDRELPEEDLGHVFVVVLPRVHDRDAQVDACRRGAPLPGIERADERRDLHEDWARIGNDGYGERFHHFDSSVAAFRKTSDTVASGSRQISVASSALQSMLFTWSERTAPDTFMRAGIGMHPHFFG